MEAARFASRLSFLVIAIFLHLSTAQHYEKERSQGEATPIIPTPRFDNNPGQEVFRNKSRVSKLCTVSVVRPNVTTTVYQPASTTYIPIVNGTYYHVPDEPENRFHFLNQIANVGHHHHNHNHNQNNNNLLESCHSHSHSFTATITRVQLRVTTSTLTSTATSTTTALAVAISTVAPSTSTSNAVSVSTSTSTQVSTVASVSLSTSTSTLTTSTNTVISTSTVTKTNTLILPAARQLRQSDSPDQVTDSKIIPTSTLSSFATMAASARHNNGVNVQASASNTYETPSLDEIHRSNKPFTV